MRRILLPIVPALLLGLAAEATAADWLFMPGEFSHHPETGQRVTQYAPVGPFYWPARPDYLESGYRHRRSSIQVGGSADHLHVVEEWGRPVRPYGEWQFPYRPFSVPYQLWGPPYWGMFQSYGPFFNERFPRPETPPQ